MKWLCLLLTEEVLETNNIWTGRDECLGSGTKVNFIGHFLLCDVRVCVCVCVGGLLKMLLEPGGGEEKN